MKRTFLYFLAVVMAVVACQDDDDFSTSTGVRLTFPCDTLTMDTVFSRTPSSTYTFWVYNNNDTGIRMQSVRLKRGNQTGFRVNVDGIYLDNSNGSQTSGLEIRSNDSLLVFVELTPAETGQLEPVVVEDDLLFELESGVEQRVCLQAWSWDARRLYDPVIAKDTLIESAQPLVIFGDMRVEEGVTLTIRNTSLYFHDSSGLEVFGSLHTDSCLMRGDRLDYMFSYLPYDRVSGQWKGISFKASSTDNQLVDTEIRNATAAVVCDSAAIDSLRPRLTMERCVVHNAAGCGVMAVNAYLVLKECQLSNTLDNCLSVSGGIAEIYKCTLAQFYPFAVSAEALYFGNHWSGHPVPLLRLWCEDTIVTGYAEDVVAGHPDTDASIPFNYRFIHSLLRTPKVETADSVYFSDMIWETSKDSIQGKKHFVKIDEENLIYDFHLDSLSTAQGMGCY